MGSEDASTIIFKLNANCSYYYGACCDYIYILCLNISNMYLICRPYVCVLGQMPGTDIYRDISVYKEVRTSVFVIHPY